MKKKKFVDPFAQREAEKYENPIPSRELILDYFREHARLIRRDELVEVFGIAEPEQQEALRRRLRAMERDGQLVFTRRGGYGIPEKMHLVRGRVMGHKDGFGFVIPEDGKGDLFISAREMRAVFDGDRVLVRVANVDRRGRREGAIIEVLEHNTKTIVGRFAVEGGVAFVASENKRITQDILVPPGEQGAAKPGQIVMVEITVQPSARKQAIGRVVEVLGEHMAPGMEIDIAVRNYNIPHEWPEELLNEIAPLRPEVSKQDLKDRVDLRHLPLVTIDGEDAKDFDDAVYCEKLSFGRGWRLFVAIADVSHYVRPNTFLDKEALKRGNSVYFPGEVVPMLPEILSNELCSLRPNVDRLCMVCEMNISGKGELGRYRFYPAVMHSQARLTYTEVAKMLEKQDCRPKYRELLPHLQTLHALYKALHAKRKLRGAIDFETTETKVIFDKTRKIKQIIPGERNVAHRIIEECMLLANVSAAQFLLKQKVPALYRVHSGPNPDKLEDLRAFLKELSLRFPATKTPEPGDYAKLLQSIAGRPDAHLIQTVLLRSLSQAVYSPNNVGHFGLAFKAYAHFTSPIRRYPDLLVHRAIRHALLASKKTPFYYDDQAMIGFGEHCSMTERRADEATRDTLDWLKCEFMSDRVGEEFDGVISSVTGFGLFVELKDVYVEGLVHITALKNDYYRFDPVKHRLQGERTGTIYHLGDSLKIRVVRVGLEDRQIDFELVETQGSRGKKQKKSKKHG